MTTYRPADQTRPSSSTRLDAKTPLLLRSVGLKTIWDERKSIFWWGGGTAVLSAIVIMLYPSIASGPELEQLLEQLPPAIQAMMGENIDLTTPEGYLNLRMFTFIAPVIFLTYAIGRGTAAVAGEERRGTLDLLLSHPVRRWRIIVEKSASMLVGLIMIGFGLWLGTVAGALLVDVEMNFGRLAQATLMSVLLGTFYGGLALAIGGGSGRTGLAMGISAAVAIVGYFLHTLAPLVDWLDPWKVLSPFYYYIEQPAVLDGMNAAHATVLALLSLVLVAAAVIVFRNRDVQV